MSKLTNSLVPSVQSLIEALNVKIMLYSELVENEKLFKKIGDVPDHYYGFYHSGADVIVIKDEHLNNSTEVVLHELIHWAGAEGRLNRKWMLYSKAVLNGKANEEMSDYVDNCKDTEEATAEIGMLKLVMVLGLNPATYADLTLNYLESLLSFNLKKADKDSDDAVEYLVSFLGMRKVA